MDLNAFLRKVPGVAAVSAFYDDLIRLARTAYVSRITDLPNRNALDELAKGYDLELRAQLGLAFLDLSGFKAVNDRYGHHAGDAALKAVGQALLALVQLHEAKPFHNSGDEFIVLASSDRIAEFAGAAWESIGRADVPVQYDGKSILGVRASIGYSVSAGDTSLETLMNQADHACQFAKLSGAGGAVLWSPELEAVPAPQRERCSNCGASSSLHVLGSRRLKDALTNCPNCKAVLAAEVSSTIPDAGLS